MKNLASIEMNAISGGLTPSTGPNELQACDMQLCDNAEVSIAAAQLYNNVNGVKEISAKALYHDVNCAKETSTKTLRLYNDVNRANNH